MNKKILFIILILAIYGCAWGDFAIIAHGDYLFKDPEFKKFYGEGGFLPSIELKAGVLKGIKLYGQLGYFKKDGYIEAAEADCKISHLILTAGMQYGASEKNFGIFVKAGLAIARYQEELLGEKISDNALGFEISAGLSQVIFKRFVIVAEAGYLHINAKVEKYDAEPKLGGIKTGIGFGIIF